MLADDKTFCIVVGGSVALRSRLIVVRFPQLFLYALEVGRLPFEFWCLKLVKAPLSKPCQKQLRRPRHYHVSRNITVQDENTYRSTDFITQELSRELYVLYNWREDSCAENLSKFHSEKLDKYLRERTKVEFVSGKGAKEVGPTSSSFKQTNC